ncbi:MAG: protease modulator HflC, partial [Candidatus Omnitrophica bacterium]|nr:protease modulator HflC [Candidatus Omnitrophota bacterium]MBU1851047.1 protease modulator HflC [Candidatus Omnitrophota bacterium]
MKNISRIIITLCVIVTVGFLTGAVYIVSEVNQAVITQFGKPVGDPIATAGLHFKVPIIQKIHYFDKRLLVQDGDPNQIPTRDKKYIWVDTTARWKIKDALKFLQSVGDERSAYTRLDDIINSATRDVITKRPLVEVIRNSNTVLDEEDNVAIASFAEEALAHIKEGREAMEAEILERAKQIAPQYGIELVDVRIKRINYVENVRRKVYERMISERKRAAEEYRSEGRGKSAEIKGRMEKELKSITSEAYKTAQTLRGEADARATITYAGAYNNDPDFYDFLKTMETYKSTMGTGTTVLLTTDS